MNPVSVNLKKLNPSLLVLPKVTRKTKAQLVIERAEELEGDLEDLGDRNGYLYQAPSKGGLGVKSTRALERGQFFMEYAGSLLSKADAMKRDNTYSEEGKGCFIMYFKYKVEHLAVDATLSTRKGRFINHNKRGNLVLKVALDNKNQPRVLLVTSRKIAAGEIVEYDYGERDVETLRELTWLK